MAIISEAINTMIEMRKNLGDTEAADTAIQGIMTEATELFADQFPIKTNVMGILEIDISRTEFDTFLASADRIFKTYIQEIALIDTV